MLFPASIASRAAFRTTSGTGVSHTPWDRLMPPARVHSIVMFRISDCFRKLIRLPSRGIVISFELRGGDESPEERALRSEAYRIFGLFVGFGSARMKVVVTGGSGQLGTLVLERLV